VGYSFNLGQLIATATVWNGMTPTDLNTEVPFDGPGFALSHAYAINDRGQIVVNGYFSANGPTVGFSLTPCEGVSCVGPGEVLHADPAPVISAGLPGLIFAGGGFLVWWRNKRRAQAVV
jgi:hypothetical protein